MNPFKTNYFIHAANLLLLVGYSLSDILLLRLLTAAASLIAIPYFALQPAPMWVPISWNTVLAAINLFQSWRIFVKRRTAKLTPGEENLRQPAFPSFLPPKVLEVGSPLTSQAARGARLRQPVCDRPIC